jgi:hypothetical protein
MMKLKAIGLVTLAVAAVGYLAPQAQAQQTPENIADAMTRAIFDRSGDIYRNSGIDRQTTLLFGLSYPEQEYLSDAQSIERLYREGMRQQAAKDNVVRTADLPNPFNTSVGSLAR